MLKVVKMSFQDTSGAVDVRFGLYGAVLMTLVIAAVNSMLGA